MDWASDRGYLAFGATDLRKGYEGLFKDRSSSLKSIASSFTHDFKGAVRQVGARSLRAGRDRFIPKRPRPR